MVFIPTYLYIKQHSITGKLYFGKSVKSEKKMLEYRGSGTYWKNHIQKYGAFNVITLWYQLYDNVFDLVADAMGMSIAFDIVENKSWLNQIPEIGMSSATLSGIMKIKNPMHLPHVKLNHSKMFSGDKNPFYNKKHSKKSKDKSSKTRTRFHDFITPNDEYIERISVKDLCIRFNLKLGSVKKYFTRGDSYMGYIQFYSYILNDAGINPNYMHKFNKNTVHRKIKNINPEPKQLYMIKNINTGILYINTISKIGKNIGMHLRQIRYDNERISKDGWYFVRFIDYPTM